MEAAIAALRSLSPARIVVAAPVGARESCERIGRLADEIICAEMPEYFSAVGQWYDDFSETSDDEVRELLARSQHASEPATRVATVRVPVDRDSLEGELTLPPNPIGAVLFAHGSGSSRHSPRNQLVARALQARGLATLLIDLLTAAEETVDRRTAHLRFDIPLLASRLVAIVGWLRTDSEAHALRLGMFGASTGGGAALVAAAERPLDVRAVVSRGGRPDLAGAALARVTAPTLLIVGSLDDPVIALNQTALTRMRGVVSLKIVAGATHLFEEPGTLEKVAELAGDWFVEYLRDQAPFK
jgi:dienelactone hydrolase